MQLGFQKSFGFVAELRYSFSRFCYATKAALNQRHVLLNGCDLKQEKCSFLPYKHTGVVTE